MQPSTIGPLWQPAPGPPIYSHLGPSILLLDPPSFRFNQLIPVASGKLKYIPHVLLGSHHAVVVEL